MKTYALRRRPATPHLEETAVGNRILRVHTKPSVLFIEASCRRRRLASSFVEHETDGIDITIVCTADELEDVRDEFNGRFITDLQARKL